MNSESRNAFNLAIKKGILAFSASTLDEFQLVFQRSKFDKYVSSELRNSAIQLLSEKGIFFEVLSKVQICRDPKDDMFLNLAFDAKASCIVTGDADLMVLHPFRGIPILSPREFLEKYKSRD